MKIDFFEFIMGILWLIMGILYFIFKKDFWTSLIMFSVGVVILLKSYFQDKMNLRILFNDKNK